MLLEKTFAQILFHLASYDVVVVWCSHFKDKFEPTRAAMVQWFEWLLDEQEGLGTHSFKTIIQTRVHVQQDSLEYHCIS